MNTTQIEYFRKIVEVGNMTKAAAELHVSQPSLSRMIKMLEDELDTKLFNRIGREIVLSRAGKAFYETCGQFLAQVGMIRLAARTNADTEGTLTLVTCIENMFVSRMISEFSLLYPRILLREETSYAYDNAVNWKDCDFVIRATSNNDLSRYSDGYVGKQGESVSFESDGGERDLTRVEQYDDDGNHLGNSAFVYLTSILEEPYTLVVNKDMKIASKEIVTLEEAKDIPFILPTAGHSHRARILEYCKKHGFEPKCRMETTHYSIALEMISRSECAALIPRDAPGTAGFSQIRMLTLDDTEINRVINLYQNSSKEETDAAVAFRDFIMSELELRDMVN